MQTRQLDVVTNTKTQDNVTVTVKTAIMYHVDPASVDTFYFKLHNPHQQITAYVDDCIRSQVTFLHKRHSTYSILNHSTYSILNLG